MVRVLVAIDTFLEVLLIRVGLVLLSLGFVLTLLARLVNLGILGFWEIVLVCGGLILWCCESCFCVWRMLDFLWVCGFEGCWFMNLRFGFSVCVISGRYEFVSLAILDLVVICYFGVFGFWVSGICVRFVFDCSLVCVLVLRYCGCAGCVLVWCLGLLFFYELILRLRFVVACLGWVCILICLGGCLFFDCGDFCDFVCCRWVVVWLFGTFGDFCVLFCLVVFSCGVCLWCSFWLVFWDCVGCYGVCIVVTNFGLGVLMVDCWNW